jgi:hypothetical protein
VGRTPVDAEWIERRIPVGSGYRPFVPCDTGFPARAVARSAGIGHLRAMKGGLSRRWADYPGVLERDPGSRKWMVRCVGCDRAGLRGETPDQFWNRPWLERLGRLRLDARALCEMCQRAADARRT